MGKRYDGTARPGAARQRQPVGAAAHALPTKAPLPLAFRDGVHGGVFASCYSIGVLSVLGPARSGPALINDLVAWLQPLPENKPAGPISDPTSPTSRSVIAFIYIIWRIAQAPRGSRS